MGGAALHASRTRQEAGAQGSAPVTDGESPLALGSEVEVGKAAQGWGALGSWERLWGPWAKGRRQSPWRAAYMRSRGWRFGVGRGFALLPVRTHLHPPQPFQGGTGGEMETPVSFCRRRD